MTAFFIVLKVQLLITGSAALVLLIFTVKARMGQFSEMILSCGHKMKRKYPY